MGLCGAVRQRDVCAAGREGHPVPGPGAEEVDPGLGLPEIALEMQRDASDAIERACPVARREPAQGGIVGRPGRGWRCGDSVARAGRITPRGHGDDECADQQRVHEGRSTDEGD